MRIFYRWTEAAVYLKELILRSTPIAGKGIIIERTALGRRISSTNAGGGGSSKYKGPFLVENSSDEDGAMVTVCNGSNPESVYAGIYQHGIEKINVPYDIIPVETSGQVYVSITHNGNYHQFEYDVAGQTPSSVNGEINLPLAEITVNDGKITAIRQIQQGNLITPGVL